MCFFTNGFSPLKNCLSYKQSLNVIYLQTSVHVFWIDHLLLSIFVHQFRKLLILFHNVGTNASENVGKIKTPLCLPWLSIDRISIIRMVDTMHSAGPMVRSANSQQPLKNKKNPTPNSIYQR